MSGEGVLMRKAIETLELVSGIRTVALSVSPRAPTPSGPLSHAARKLHVDSDT
jgi:hypothetical protein